MKSIPVRVALVSLLVVAGGTLSIFGAVAAQAAGVVPFVDSNVRGSLGFCNLANQPVTSGSITAVPFVWKAVSSSPAPKAYAVPSGKATLYAFSPIQSVNSGDWSPYQLTASSFYSNVAHPMAVATSGDGPLQYQTTAFPPTLNGLVQVRMYFSAPNQMPYNMTYPAAVIRVSGDSWSLVQGNTSPDCSSGAGKSAEEVLLPLKLRPKAPPAAGSSPATSTSTSTAAGQTGGVSAAPNGVGTSPGGTASSSAVASGQADSSSTPAGLPIGLGVLVVAILVAGAAWAVVRRRLG